MKKHDRVAGFVLLLVTCLGLYFRCYPVGESLWLDELHTAWTVLAEDNQALAQRAQLGNNSTVYFRFVRVVTGLFGTSELTLRCISIIAGTLLIPITFLVSRDGCGCGPIPAATAALLVCIDRYHNFYACEARTYALVQLVALIHFGLFILLLTRDRQMWNWVWWTISGMSLFHLHCTSALFLFAEIFAFVVLVWMRFPVKVHLRYLIIGFGIIAVSALSNLELVRILAERRENWSHFIMPTRQPQRMLWLFRLDVYVFFPSVASAVVWFAKQRFVSSEPIEAESHRATRHGISITACLITLCAPVVVAWLLTEADITRLFHRRYLICSSVPLAILTANVVSAMSVGRVRMLVCVLVSSCALLNISPRLHNRVAENWRSAIPAINALPPAEPLILYSGLIEADGWWNADDEARRAYCQFPLNSMYPLNSERTVVSLPRTIGQIATAIPQVDTNTVWLLTRASEQKKAQVVASVQAALGNRWSQRQQASFGRLTLIKLATDAQSE